LNSKYLYLLIDLSAISLPLLFSFHPKANFSKKWKHLWPAILIPAIFFLVWDEWFTRMGVWGFNPNYVSGVYFFDLPIEEVLFFICIPYACVFTYEAVSFFSKRDYFKPITNGITGILVVILSVIAFSNLDGWYTAATFLLCALFLLYLHLIVKPKFLGKFYLSYLFILIPFVLVNGVLTGTGLESPVVWYNDAENLGFRIGTIPIEDTIYGMLLILMNVTIFEHLQSKEHQRQIN
jgi:lycopene cyclase domain-containing protein